MPAGFLFGIDQLALTDHIKDASATFDKFNINTLEMTFKVGRQTDGIRAEVSLASVMNLNLHGSIEDDPAEMETGKRQNFRFPPRPRIPRL